MRPKEWEIGGKRTKSRGRIGRRSIKARTKESATATTTTSQAQHRLITDEAQRRRLSVAIGELSVAFATLKRRR